jgi:hypothetical protein
MNSPAYQQTLLWRGFLVYAKGLASMLATGLGIFATFCAVIAIQKGLFLFGDWMLFFHLALILMLVYFSRKDPPGSAEHRLAHASLWIFYLVISVELMAPIFRTYARETIDYWSWPVATTTGLLTVFWSYLMARGTQRFKLARKLNLNSQQAEALWMVFHDKITNIDVIAAKMNTSPNEAAEIVGEAVDLANKKMREESASHD